MKIFDSNGTLRDNPKSPKGYSYSYDASILEGENVSDNISSWGNKSTGYWAAGDYRIEFWYDNRILAAKSFKVY